MTTHAPPDRASVMVWSMPLASTSVAPEEDRQVIEVTARAVTTAERPSSEGALLRTVTAHSADSAVRPRRRPRSAVPRAS